MQLFGHHIGVEIFGKEFSPETPMEHIVAFGLTGLLLSLAIYGGYAAVRDFRRWRRGEGQQGVASRS